MLEEPPRHEVPGLTELWQLASSSAASMMSLSPEIGVAGLLGLLLGGLFGSLITAFVHARLQRHMGDRFETLSARALDRNTERFLALAGERLGTLERSSVEALARREAAVDALIRPLRESLARVDEKLHRVETERHGHYEALTKHLELVAVAHRSLEEETRNLGQALRAPQARGRWGELQLRRVVELAGMLEHCDFLEQPTLRSGDSLSRPDLIVRLPGDRQIAIDAKAPLEAYLAASEAEDEDEAGRCLEAHARHVRRHLDELSSRAYWSRLDGSPEFVVLFLPGEPFFSAALARDPELIERGVARRVLIASPTTLIALLRAIAQGWQQEEMTENAMAISRLGRELHERIVTLSGHFETLGRKLDGAVVAYNTAIGSFESRVRVSARRMADLGVSSPEPLPDLPEIDRRVREPRSISGENPSPDAAHVDAS
ncbi:MAG TPA: DNA recombination protein RmuC [Deltaproteobacteria bacterium]|nr:DNA recombination protein RmuC [Deltaproteobacteria bacterium]